LLILATERTGGGDGALNAGGDTGCTAFGFHSLFNDVAPGQFNTAIGDQALASNTTGVNNNAVGYQTLVSNTTGPFNNAFGNGALSSNTTGDRNTAIGEGALLTNTTGFQNVGIGVSALRNNATGNNNIAIGQDACSQSSGGHFNTAIGSSALEFNTGNYNTAIGESTLFSNTANSNTALGDAALAENTTGGTQGGSGTSELGPNTAVGAIALFSNTTGGANTAVGFEALASTVDQGFSTAVGFKALANSTLSYNDAFGYKALNSNTSGVGNTAIGALALFDNTTGIDNVALGNGAGFSQTNGVNNVYIGNSMFGIAGENNACYIGSIFGQTSVSGVPVLINASSRLGTLTSSKRFKENIKPMDRVSETLYALKPVSFRYKKEIDPAGIPQLGLVAEEVEKVNPDLVVRDKEGQPYSVRYDAVNAMLLNEFLKEHKVVEKQQVTIAELRAAVVQQQKSFRSKFEAQEKQIAVLTSGLRKIDAEFELRKPDQQLAFRNHRTRISGNP
jgi:hypothetical protein